MSGAGFSRRHTRGGFVDRYLGNTEARAKRLKVAATSEGGSKVIRHDGVVRFATVGGKRKRQTSCSS
jgi:hypothetical protein